MKEQILSMMTLQIRRAVEDLNYDNLTEQSEIIRHCLAILESTKRLPDLPSPNIESADDSFAKQPVLMNESLEEPHLDATNVLTPYRFERKIKGGFLPEIDAFVPEKVVRELHLHHGDMVYAKFIKNQDKGPALYEYSVAERNNGKDPEERIQINYAIVEYDPSINRFVCQKKADGSLIRLDDVPYTAVLASEDVQELNLASGDVIDIAFSKANPNYVRVLWKYSTNTIPMVSSSKPANTKNKNVSEDSKEKSVLPIFQGKQICVVGFEPGKDAFRTEVEKRGGEFLWISGNEPEPTVASTLGKADAVIMLLRYVRHHSTNYAVDFCKQHRIPFTSMQTLGRSSFVSTVESLLNSNA